MCRQPAARGSARRRTTRASRPTRVQRRAWSSLNQNSRQSKRRRVSRQQAPSTPQAELDPARSRPRAAGHERAVVAWVEPLAGAESRVCHPRRCRALTAHVQQDRPEIFNQAMAFYAQHPMLVKTLFLRSLRKTPEKPTIDNGATFCGVERRSEKRPVDFRTRMRPHPAREKKDSRNVARKARPAGLEPAPPVLCENSAHAATRPRGNRT